MAWVGPGRGRTRGARRVLLLLRSLLLLLLSLHALELAHGLLHPRHLFVAHVDALLLQVLEELAWLA